ncbi:hypothetical protein AK88_01854 [Plasmodium fragile]|uniref:Schizont-infected cell agglutination C-terminal domain-containing protein n=1 Tax=Plasmodium fragile TaxID=5857 RepID=A0A0D9QNM3_PLAFR|nr:uncharacterized protein AK88_01854 [Plasmodium fragile]KJP88402.1 hypothetical protein AK88_01854 [Plasmodium fragile]
MLMQHIKEYGVTVYIDTCKISLLQRQLLTIIEENFQQFMEHMGDSSMIEAYGSNCNNDESDYWNEHGRTPAGTRIMMTKEDRTVCMLMTGALSFANGWGTRAKYKEGTSEDERKADEFIKCALANIYMYTLEQTRHDGKDGIEYAWYLMKGMEASEMENLIKDEKCKKGAQEYGKGPNDQIKNRIRSLLKSKDGTFNRIKEDAVKNEQVQKVISAAVEKKEEEKVIQRKSGNKDSTNATARGHKSEENRDVCFAEVKTGAGGRASMWNYLIVLWDDYIETGKTGVKETKEFRELFWKNVHTTWKEFKEYMDADDGGMTHSMCEAGQRDQEADGHIWTGEDLGICELAYIALRFKHGIQLDGTPMSQEGMDEQRKKIHNYMRCILVNIFMKKIMGMKCLEGPGGQFAFGLVDDEVKGVYKHEFGNVECEWKDAGIGGDGTGRDEKDRGLWEVMKRWFDRNKGYLRDGETGVLGEDCRVVKTTAGTEQQKKEHAATVKETVKAEIKNVEKDIKDKVQKILTGTEHCNNGDDDCVKNVLEKEKEKEKKKNKAPAQTPELGGKSPEIRTTPSSEGTTTTTSSSRTPVDPGSAPAGPAPAVARSDASVEETPLQHPPAPTAAVSPATPEPAEEKDKEPPAQSVPEPGPEPSKAVSTGTSTLPTPSEPSAGPDVSGRDAQSTGTKSAWDFSSVPTKTKLWGTGEGTPDGGGDLGNVPDSVDLWAAGKCPSNGSVDLVADYKNGKCDFNFTPDTGLNIGDAAGGFAPSVTTPRSSSSSNSDPGDYAVPDLTANVLTATTPILFFLTSVIVALLGYSLWKYFAYLAKRRRTYRTVRDVPSPPLDEEILQHLQRGEPPPDYGYTMIRDRRPASAAAGRRHPRRVHKRTIIELHLEVLHECEAAAWETVKEDYLQILVEQFAHDLEQEQDRNNTILGVSTTNQDLSRNNVSSTVDPPTESDGTDLSPPNDEDSDPWRCMATMQFATAPCPPNEPDPWRCMETIELETDPSAPNEADSDACSCMEPIQLATDTCPPHDPDAWSCMETIPLATDPSPPHEDDPWSCMKNIQLDAQQSRAHSNHEHATSECTQWIPWIDITKYLLRECTTQPWFLQLKSEWKQYLREHMAVNEVFGNSALGEHGNMPSTEMKKLRLWKQWVAKQHRQVIAYREEEWFQYLLRNIEEENGLTAAEGIPAKITAVKAVGDMPTVQEEPSTFITGQMLPVENGLKGEKSLEAEQALKVSHLPGMQQHNTEMYMKTSLTSKLWLLILSSVIEQCEMEQNLQETDTYLDNLLENMA